MALKPVVYKWLLNLSDLNRHNYADYHITLALHPSETLERLVARMVAFALNASEELAFTKGLSTVEEPDIWAKALDGQTDIWIEIGEPAPERVKKASHHAKHVKVYSFNSKSDVWWQQDESKFNRLNADFLQLNSADIAELAEDVQRTMKWFITISDNSASINTDIGERTVSWRLLHGQSEQ